MPPAKVALKGEPIVAIRPRVQTRIVRSNPAADAGPWALPHDVSRLESPKLRPVAVPSQPNSRRENFLRLSVKQRFAVGCPSME